MKTIRNKDKELLYGVMEENILGNGKMVDNMAEEYLFYLMESKEKENGLMERGKNGTI
jgi:hypothetical protein